MKRRGFPLPGKCPATCRQPPLGIRPCLWREMLVSGFGDKAKRPYFQACRICHGVAMWIVVLLALGVVVALWQVILPGRARPLGACDLHQVVDRASPQGRGRSRSAPEARPDPAGGQAQTRPSRPGRRSSPKGPSPGPSAGCPRRTTCPGGLPAVGWTPTASMPGGSRVRPHSAVNPRPPGRCWSLAAPAGPVSGPYDGGHRMDFGAALLFPFQWLVSAIMVGLHDGLSALGMPAGQRLDVDAVHHRARAGRSAPP